VCGLRIPFPGHCRCRRESQRDVLISRCVIHNHDIQLVSSSVLTESGNVKTKQFINTNFMARLLVVPMICSLAFVACSDLGGMAETHATVNLQSAAMGVRQNGNKITIGPSASDARVLLTRIGR
jgi:hypothetical protein